jgi:Mg2+-importing ATPase
VNNGHLQGHGSELGKNLHLQHQYENIDEIPFDFVHRRLSVILSREDGTHVLICKGAIDEVFSVCKHYELDNECGTLDASHLAQAQAKTRALNEDGFRVVAIAYKEIVDLKKSYSVEDESDLTLLGYIAFLDPPKETAGAAIAALIKIRRRGQDYHRRQRNRHPQDLSRGWTQSRSCRAWPRNRANE